MSALQWAQLGVASAQLNQLSALNAQLRQQQNAHAYQAILGEAIFQTERRAKQLSVVAGEDPFVAAMFADEWLQSVATIAPDHFLQLEHKRIWAGATARLQSLTMPLADPAKRSQAVAVREAAAEASRLQRNVGGTGDPETRLATLTKERDAAQSKGKRMGLLGVGSYVASIVVPFTVLIVAAIINGVMTGGKKGQDEVDLSAVSSICVLLFLGLAILGTYGIVSWLSGRDEAKKADESFQKLRTSLGAWHTFASDPNWGGMLARFYAEHPAYSRPLPNVDDMAPLSMTGSAVAAGPPSQIIERQTVVTRCRYCKQLTPVDAPTCQHCAAPSFS
jgi:fumarate reductase subunit D